MHRFAIVVFLMVLFCAVASSFSATINVPSQQPTIQAGINAAVNGDTVLVAPGMYQETFSYNGKSVCVRGEKGADSTILTFPEMITSLITFAGTPDTFAVLMGVTIEDVVHRGADVGLINVTGSSANIRDCRFRNNSDGGVANSGESIIRSMGGGVVIIEGCLFENNVALGGAGVGLNSPCGRIVNNRFVRNRTWGSYGGAIVLGGSTPLGLNISGNTFIENENTGQDQGASSGGAIFMSVCTNITIERNTFVGNRTGDNGGGLCFWSCGPGNSVRQNIFVANSGYAVSGGQPEFYGNISYANTPSAYKPGLAIDSCSVSADPLFCDVASGNFNLHPYSPCWPSNNSCGLMIGAPADTCWPTIRNVPGDYATIQAGIDAALPRDTVLVAPGTYYENIDFKGKCIVVASEYILTGDSLSIATTTIDGNQQGVVVAFTGASDTTTALVGFSITNGRGISASTSNYYGGGIAIVEGSTASPRIEHNRIFGNNANGGSGAGIAVVGLIGATPPANLPPIRIANNRIFSNTAVRHGAAIYAEGRSLVELEDNLIYNNLLTGPMEYSSAVELAYVNGGRIVNNSILSHGFSALSTGTNVQVQFRNNLFAFNNGNLNGAGAIYCRTGDWGYLSVDHNCFYDIGQEFNFSMPGLQDTSFSNDNGTKCDSFFNLYLNPRFIDTGSVDFNLSANSPCIDAGDPDPAYFDADGTIGDIGALAYYHKILVQSLSVASEDQQHVVSNTPTFVWSHGPLGEVTQDSANIELTTDSAWLFVDTWESGAVATADTVLQYDGTTALLDGDTYFIRIRLFGGAAWSPWYYASFRMNSVPTSPILRAPTNLAVVGSTPTLWVTNGSDAESDPLTYEFAGFHDTDCVAGPAIDLIGVASGFDSTGGQIVDLLAENCRYWWRVRSYDGFEYSDWSQYAQFMVNGIPEAPTAPMLTSPPLPDGKPIFDLLPTLSWTPSYDPDPGDTARYRVELSLFPSFSFAFGRDSLLGPDLTLTDSLAFGTHYWWRVTAQGKDGLSSTSAAKDFWTWKLGDMNHSHSTDLSDLSLLIGYLTQTPRPDISPKMVADLTGDCRIDLSDLSTMVAFMTTSGVQLLVGCE